MKLKHIITLLVALPVFVNAQTQLSLNENPYGPSPAVVNAIKQELPNIFRYTGHEGDDLVAAIARHEGVDKDQIIPGDVLTSLGIYLGVKGGKGGEFIYSVPGYPALVDAAATVGGVVISVPLNDKKENDLAAITQKINANTQAIYLVNPHNPSGTVTDNKLFHDFIHQASQRSLIVVDEAYLEFSDDFAGRTAVNNIKAGDNVIVFRTFAKAYGLAGLAFGYAVAPKALADYLKKQGLGSVHDLNRLSIVAVQASLSDSGYIKTVHDKVAIERQKWNKALDDLHLQHTNSEANFIFFNINKPYDDVNAKFKKAGITIARSFPPYNTWIRITIGLPDENLRAQEVVRQLVK
jgi:histidinol-phosphate aminotransferase